MRLVSFHYMELMTKKCLRMDMINKIQSQDNSSTNKKYLLLFMLFSLFHIWVNLAASKTQS